MASTNSTTQNPTNPLNSVISDANSSNPALSSVLGAAAAGSASSGLANSQAGAATQNQQAAISTLTGVQQSIASLLPPNLSSLAQPLAQLLFTGDYSVDQVIGAIQQQSALNGVQIDPAALQAQTQTLQQYQQVAQQGYTPIERAQIAQTMNQIQTQNAGAQQAIVQQNQAQGQGGVVNSLAARLIAQQGAAQQGALAGGEIAASGQQRAINALAGEQSTAGDIANEQAQLAVQKGSAQNTINQFNTAQQQQAALANQAANAASASQGQQINYQTQAQNAQNQLASQNQAISAANQTFANEATQTGQEENNAQSQASVYGQYGVPEESASLGNAQNAAGANAAALTGAGTTAANGISSLLSSGNGAVPTSSYNPSSYGDPNGSSITDNFGNNNYGSVNYGSPDLSDVGTDATDQMSDINLGDDIGDLFADGGDVEGPGTETSDSIPARLSNHEFVVNADSTSKYKPVLEAINDGKEPNEVKSLLDMLVPPRKPKYKSAMAELAEEEDA